MRPGGTSGFRAARARSTMQPLTVSMKEAGVSGPAPNPCGSRSLQHPARKSRAADRRHGQHREWEPSSQPRGTPGCRRNAFGARSFAQPATGDSPAHTVASRADNDQHNTYRFCRLHAETVRPQEETSEKALQLKRAEIAASGTHHSYLMQEPHNRCYLPGNARCSAGRGMFTTLFRCSRGLASPIARLQSVPR